jgi:hypothetical protein
MGNSSLTRIKTDTGKWMDQVGSLIGETQILLYPYGSTLDYKSGEFKYLQDCGFKIFCGVGYESYVSIKTTSEAVVCDRRHPDGTTLRNSRKKYLDLYDAKEIFDYENRPDRPYDFS